MNGTEGLLTAEEFEAGGSKYDFCELWDGALLVREPEGGPGSEVTTRLLVRLNGHVYSRDLGWTPSQDTGFLLRRDPDRVLAADVSFVSMKRLPSIPRQGFWPVAPDFVVDVRSPSDRWADVVKKCGVWIAHGTLVAWALDPNERRIVVMRPDLPAVEAGPDDEVDAAPALPEFRVRVGDLFEGI
jgi:Uma2 family endonuclease